MGFRRLLLFVWPEASKTTVLLRILNNNYYGSTIFWKPRVREIQRGQTSVSKPSMSPTS